VSVIAFGPSRQPAPSSTVRLKVDDSVDPAVQVGEHPSRKVYPYSVVPGGVYTTAELADAAAQDPTVAEHYADVTPTAMHVKVVDAVREAYMSYRIGERIFWTKRKLPLRKGERILTDGDVAIRARCGNRLSDVPRAPTSDVEPTAEEFEPAVDEFERDAAPLFTVGLGPDSPIAMGPPGLWPDGSLPRGVAPTSDGGSSGGFFDGGGFYGDLGIPPIGSGGGTPGAPEPNGEQPPSVFVLPPADGADHPDSPDRGDDGDVPSVNVQIPGFTHIDRPGDGSGESAGQSPDETWLAPETSDVASEGELPQNAVVPEPTTLALLGTALVLGAVKRHRRRTKNDR
jgi:hypothetical protein